MCENSLGTAWEQPGNKTITIRSLNEPWPCPAVLARLAVSLPLSLEWVPVTLRSSTLEWNGFINTVIVFIGTENDFYKRSHTYTNSLTRSIRHNNRMMGLKIELKEDIKASQTQPCNPSADCFQTWGRKGQVILGRFLCATSRLPHR